MRNPPSGLDLTPQSGNPPAAAHPTLYRCLGSGDGLAVVHTGAGVGARPVRLTRSVIDPVGTLGRWCRGVLPGSVPRSAGAGRKPFGKGLVPLAVVSMKELLEAGVHFGHQTRRWNPKMRRFIHAERGGIYIIDLQQTQVLLQEAHDFARNVTERGGVVLFVGTKKQAQDAVSEEATRVGMPFVNHRWLGGLLTNWKTISDRIAYLHELRRLKEEGQLELLPAKERITLEGELEKLEANLGGVADLKRQPDAIYIVDLRTEQLAVKEARRLDIPVIALVDTNCDPDEADYVVPGNDDAIRSCALVTRAIADGVAAGRTKVTTDEMVTAEEPAPAAAEPVAATAEPTPAEAKGPEEAPAADDAGVPTEPALETTETTATSADASEPAAERSEAR
jgi:small subunit ribosomal protein S2